MVLRAGRPPRVRVPCGVDWSVYGETRAYLHMAERSYERRQSPAEAVTALPDPVLPSGSMTAPSQQAQGRSLFVTGIADRLEEAELREMFSTYGKVEKCKIMIDPHTKESRGFGFVQMATVESADAAREALTGEERYGRILSVDRARRDRPRTPTPGKYFGPPKKDHFSWPYGHYSRYHRYDRYARYDRADRCARIGTDTRYTYDNRYHSRGYDRGPLYDRFHPYGSAPPGRGYSRRRDMLHDDITFER